MTPLNQGQIAASASGRPHPEKSDLNPVEPPCIPWHSQQWPSRHPCLWAYQKSSCPGWWLPPRLEDPHHHGTDHACLRSTRPYVCASLPWQWTQRRPSGWRRLPQTWQGWRQCVLKEEAKHQQKVVQLATALFSLEVCKSVNQVPICLQYQLLEWWHCCNHQRKDLEDLSCC